MSAKIIDIHVHIGSFKGYDLSEATLLAETEGAGIALALVSNIDGAAVEGKTLGLSETEANRATERFVRSNPTRFRGLLWGRPDRGDASALEPFMSARVTEGGWTSRLFVGMKLHPEMNHTPADAPSFDPYMAFAQRHRIPVVAHCDGIVDEASPERLFALGRRWPEVDLVLYHTGFQGPHEPAIEAAATAAAQGSARLWLETAQLPPEAALQAVERVGANRVLFGTDATFYGRGHYARYQPLLEALRTELSDSDRNRILRENALELFRLGAQSP